MFEVHDEVTVVSDDRFDGAVGVVVGTTPHKEALVMLEDEARSLWFFFSELRKVGA